MHNVLIGYECIYENYENILSILDKKKLDSREKTDFLLQYTHGERGEREKQENRPTKIND